MRKLAGITASILVAAALAPGLASAQSPGGAAHSGVPSAAECAPKKLVHIVVREVTPGIDPASFGAKPRDLYRLGNDKLRSEEVDDPEHHIHQTNVISEPDLWIANLDDGTGIHAVDPGPTFNVLSPVIIGEGVSPRLARLEFGCEADFIKANALKPVRVEQVEGAPYDVYRLGSDGDAVEILKKRNATTPAFTRYIHAGDLVLVWRYELYDLSSKADASLFKPPAGVNYQEQTIQ